MILYTLKSAEGYLKMA